MATGKFEVTSTLRLVPRACVAFGSRRDIELLVGARILYGHCVRWGMMPHTAGKTRTVAMYFGQPVVNLRELLPDEAIPPIKMRDGGPGEAPVVQEL